jgi:hypothetical protein
LDGGRHYCMDVGDDLGLAFSCAPTQGRVGYMRAWRVHRPKQLACRTYQKGLRPFLGSGPGPDVFGTSRGLYSLYPRPPLATATTNRQLSILIISIVNMSSDLEWLLLRVGESSVKHTTSTDIVVGEQFFHRQAAPGWPHLFERTRESLCHAQHNLALTAWQGNLVNIHSQKFSGLANTKVSLIVLRLHHVVELLIPIRLST